MSSRSFLQFGLFLLALHAALSDRVAFSASMSLRDEMVAKAKKEEEIVFMGDIATELKTRLNTARRPCGVQRGGRESDSIEFISGIYNFTVINERGDVKLCCRDGAR